MCGRVRLRFRSLLLAVLVCLPQLPMDQKAIAATQGIWKEDEQRVRMGWKIFPACLGALESLDEWLTPAGALLVLVVYEGGDAIASQTAVSLGAKAALRGHPLSVRMLSAGDLDAYAGERPAGIFIASVEIQAVRLRAWSSRFRALVFSPFAGAVEEGAVAGIYVADRILPFVNLAQAQRAKVRFKPFFLGVARQYEGD